MGSLLDKVKSLSAAYLNDVIAVRRHLHAHPELSFEEVATSAYISAQLHAMGIAHTTGLVKTGIVGIIEGKNPGKKVVALRADMDALPILEATACDYASQSPGVMHACGHDVHAASLLGAARILYELRNEFEGTVKLIFQPGEEKLPGGASLMIKEGVLQHPVPQAMYAQHVFPSMETGKVGFRSGMYMASTDELYLTVKGKGGHAAMPADYVNPLLIAARILTALNTEFMEKKQAIPTVLAFGKMQAAGATNVIPDEVKLEGTFRTMDEQWRAAAHKQLKQLAADIATEMGGTAELRVEVGYPFLVNNENLTNAARLAAESYLGKENVEELPLRMTAEDFAFFSQQLPSCFYRLGTGNKAKGIVSGVHTATFNIDEKALEIGAGLLAWITLDQLGAKK